MTDIFLIVLIIVIILFLLFANRQKKYRKELVNYSVAETKERLKDKTKTILIDVRTSMERRSKMIQDSIHIPIHDLKNSTEILNQHKEKEIICYCHSGVRSLKAAHILKQKGFNSANMKGGIVAWLRSEKNK